MFLFSTQYLSDAACIANGVTFMTYQAVHKEIDYDTRYRRATAGIALAIYGVTGLLDTLYKEKNHSSLHPGMNQMQQTGMNIVLSGTLYLFNYRKFDPNLFALGSGIFMLGYFYEVMFRQLG